MRWLLLAVLLLSIPAWPAEASGPRVEERPYVASGNLYWWCGLGSQDRNVGAVCFKLQGDEASVRIQVVDDSGRAAGGYFEVIRRAALSSRYTGSFCGETSLNLWGVDELRVIVSSSPLDACPGTYAGTSGKVRVEYLTGNLPETEVVVFADATTCTGFAAPVSTCSVTHAGGVALEGPCTDIGFLGEACPLRAVLRANGTSSHALVQDIRAEMRYVVNLGWGSWLVGAAGVCMWEEDYAATVDCSGTDVLPVPVPRGGCQDVALSTNLRTSVAPGVLELTSVSAGNTLRLCRDATGVASLERL